MAFEDWIAHARVSSKTHAKITIDDKMSLLPAALDAGLLGDAAAPGASADRPSSARARSSATCSRRSPARVAAGSSFNAAAAAIPKIFEPYWVEVIRTGEMTGKMGSVLLELNKQIRESRETRRKVNGALMYPMILICVAVIAVTVMLWMVVPTFAGMFKDMGAELPAITQFVVDASACVVELRPVRVVGRRSRRCSRFKHYMKTESRPAQRRRDRLMVTPMVGDADGADGDVPVLLEHRAAAQERACRCWRP